MNKNLMTKAGREKLEKELRELVDVKRPEIIKQIQEAREQGDLSENADYDAAKNMQAQIEGRIKELEDLLNNSKIISKSKSDKTKSNVVQIGSSVKLKDYSDNKISTYTIVGSVEADPTENKISNECQLAKSIMGKKVNDDVHVKGIDEPYKIKILEIN